MAAGQALDQLSQILVDWVAESRGLNIASRRVGNETEGGWIILAVDGLTGERWLIQAPCLYDVATELADQVGYDFEEE